MARKGSRERTIAEAWVGDAVLTLYVRRRILREDGAVDGAKASRMSSNQFLSSLGEPTGTEAEIGRVFEREGLEAAFRWIEQRLMPLWERQQSKRRPRGFIKF
jgi:hypothetical protein